MKRVFIVIALLLVFVVLIFFDFSSKRNKFDALKGEYGLSVNFEQIPGQINKYFFEHGWFPDSLEQIDTILSRKIVKGDIEDFIETPYRFYIDPFSDEFYYYLPVMNEKYGKPEGYYLLSAGIDSKINNRKLDKGALKLYDSASFSYLDWYFGDKDLLVSEGSIEDWLSESSGMEVSMRWLAKRYDSTGRRMLPRSVKFYGTVDSVGTDRFLVKEDQSDLRGVCYIAPSVDQLAIVEGNIVQVKGIYNKIIFQPDTVFTFLNCIILEKK